MERDRTIRRNFKRILQTMSQSTTKMSNFAKLYMVHKPYSLYVNGPMSLRCRKARWCVCACACVGVGVGVWVCGCVGVGVGVGVGVCGCGCGCVCVVHLL